MSKELLVQQLKAALNDFNGAVRTVNRLDECPTSDFVLETGCFVSFFAVIDRTDLLADTYARAQAEIVRARSTKGAKWPRDLNLVLIVAGDTPPNSGAIRDLIDDRYVCRKFVLPVNGGNIRDVLTDLPFWPPGELLSRTAPSVAAGVQEALRGYDPRLIAELVGHSPGAERISKKIQERKYNFAGEPLKSTPIAQPKLAQTVHNKLEAVEIIDFRGIRHLTRAEMSLAGDVVVIYGPNGVGKTSIVDAVEWAITGHVERLQQVPSNSLRRGPNPIVNVFSDNGQARVTCYLNNRKPILRSFDGQKTQIWIGSRGVTDDRLVIDHVVGTKAPSREARLHIGRLRDLFRGSHILSQHNIRQFLQQTEPADRFDILTNMIGAAEFVRFREKVAAVTRHLRSDTEAVAEQTKSLNRELEDLSTRLRQRQNELGQLSQTITSGRTPEELSTDVLQGLRNCQCDVDDRAIQDASAEYKSELTAIYAETAIRRKKTAVEDALLRLKSLDAELPGYVDSRSRCETLSTEIASTKNHCDKILVELEKQEKVRQDVQVQLQEAKTKQAHTARRYGNLAWLKEKLPPFRQTQERLRQMERSLLSQREDLQKSETVLRDQHNSLNQKRARLEEVQKIITVNTTRDRALLDLLNRLPHARTKWQEALQLENRANELDARLSELKRAASFAISELNASEARLNELHRLYSSEAARNDLLNSFLARLQELVRSAECPLCGRTFASTEEAKSRIGEHLSSVPLELKDLAAHLEEGKKNVENGQTHADSLTGGIRAVEAESQEVLSSSAVARKAVSDFLADCDKVAVSITKEDTISWQRALDEARTECEVERLDSEAASLSGEINALVSRYREQEDVVAQLRAKLTQLEKERSTLASQAGEFESEIAERGFDHRSLPQDGQLTAQLSRAQDEANQCSESVVKKEAELVAIESAIADHRAILRKSQEDIASKETQLRQYESSCSRFVAACRVLGLDPGKPSESIRATIQRMEELGQSIARLEEKVQVLQQVVSMTKLKMEVDGLGRTAEDATQRVEVASEKESRLRNWMSHLEKLESEVVRRQVDAIGTHLQRLEPTTQQLYHRLNPHPIFGHLRIRVNEKNHELDVEAEPSVARERLGDVSVSPSAFFSDAQMNTLAISVFLAGALRQRWSGFDTILIDDPIQQMDEMNVNAFLDLIRGLSGKRQFIIFTCSRDFYLLTLDKLDCLNKIKQGAFLAYRLEGIVPAELRVHCDAR